MAYRHFKDLTRTACDKILRDKALTLLKIQNILDMKEVLLQWFIYVLIKNSLRLEINLHAVAVLMMRNFQERIIRKIKTRKVHSNFMDNIWSADVDDMQLISKFNKGYRLLLCVTGIFQ